MSCNFKQLANDLESQAKVASRYLRDLKYNPDFISTRSHAIYHLFMVENHLNRIREKIVKVSEEAFDD